MKIMNQRIQQLVDQATTYIEPTFSSGEGWIFDKEKFAKLVVQDCLDFLEAGAANEADDSEVQAALLSCALDILEHFDIELDDKEYI